MADGATMSAARARAYATPLDAFQVHDIEHFTSDTLWPWFERLRVEDPVHYTPQSEYGPYWSLTRYADIVAADGAHARLSSTASLGGLRTPRLTFVSAGANVFLNYMVFVPVNAAQVPYLASVSPAAGAGNAISTAPIQISIRNADIGPASCRERV